MKSILFAFSVLIFLGACSTYRSDADSSSTKPNNHDQRVEDLLAQMTVKEKVGQMTQLNLDVLCVGEVYALDEPHRLDTAKLRKAIVDYAVGSILNCGGHAYPREQWHSLIGGIQKAATEETRLGIPVLYGIDAIHGANYTMGSTLFPQQLAQAATWNPEIVREAAAMTAYEVRASGISWNFSPVLDLGRDPRWSRFFETYGEDVLLCSELGKACIEGYQGDSLNDPHRVAACMKHFLGYSMPRTGKDRTPVYLHERQLREYFLPSFQHAIASGAATVMINSGEINGIPVHADPAILTKLLREELGFEGLAVTDWEDIMKLNNIHKVAPSMKEAVRMAIEAGIDMSMVPNDYEFSDLLLELVEEGSISEQRLDESVRRILKLKFDLGLFEQSLPPSLDDFPDFNSTAHQAAAKAAAEESITLLENGGILPVGRDLKLFVSGPAADDVTVLNGAWTRTWQGTDTTWNEDRQQSILDALQAAHQGRIEYDNVVSYEEDAAVPTAEQLERLKRKARGADAVLLCLGEKPSTEKVGDISDLNLPEAQAVLAEALLASGTPVIVVMTFNRPRIVNRFIDQAAAVVMTYLPGDFGGEALVSILHGDVNPSGKLPFTYPSASGELLWYDHKYTERLDPSFGMDAFQPQWNFGHGMSYTSFEYLDLRLSADTIKTESHIDVAVTLKNSGERSGKEVVQCYFSDRFADVTPSVERLRAFEKVSLEAGAVRELSFSVPIADLSYVGIDLEQTPAEGWFDIRVGNLSDSVYISLNTPL